MTLASYGSSRIDVVGPAASIDQPSFSLRTTGPQWYRTLPRSVRSGYSGQPLIQSLWRASRPVTIVPVISTASPLRRSRTAFGVRGVVSFFTALIGFALSCLLRVDGLPRGENFDGGAAGRPAHVCDRDEGAGREACKIGALAPQQRRLPAVAHRPDPQEVPLLQ